MNNAAVANNAAFGGLRIWAYGRGAWGNNIWVRIQPATQNPAGQDFFRLTVMYRRDGWDPNTFVDPTDANNLADPNYLAPDELEDRDNLSFVTGTQNSVVTAVNGSSRFIRCHFDDPATPARPPDTAWQPLGATGNDGGDPGVGDFEGDMDPITGPPPGDTTAELLGLGRGLAAFATIDEINILACPDAVRTNPVDLTVVDRRIIDQCENLQDRFAVASAQLNAGAVQNINPIRDSKYAAFYYPWIKIFDPVRAYQVTVPATGHVAGIFARTDIERGVHKAPANAVVRGTLGLERPVTKQDQVTLNPKGVNCIRNFTSDGRGFRLWGARTMSSDSMWRYVNVRRLFLFIEESIDVGTQWVMFEPNHEPTWAAVVSSVTGFLNSVWRSGALMGVTQDEAFFVKCDRTTMTQDDIDNVRLICVIGVAPVKPAEFVIFRISQKTALTA